MTRANPVHIESSSPSVIMGIWSNAAKALPGGLSTGVCCIWDPTHTTTRDGRENKKTVGTVRVIMSASEGNGALSSTCHEGAGNWPHWCLSISFIATSLFINECLIDEGPPYT